MAPSLIRPNFWFLFQLALAAALVVSLLAIGPAHADALSSDLAIRLLSAPKHAKACQVFEATFEITNLGPNDASSVYVLTSIPDSLEPLDTQGVPSTLAVGETATVTATFKVVALISREWRGAWVGGAVGSDANTDPNFDNNNVSRDLRLIGKPQPVCS